MAGRGRAWVCVCDRGHAWQGVCMAGGVHGRGMCGRGCAWQRGMHDRVSAWQGVCMAGLCMEGVYMGEACMAGGVRVRGSCMAGKTAIAAGGTHPTGMHSGYSKLCFSDLLDSLNLLNSLNSCWQGFYRWC